MKYSSSATFSANEKALINIKSSEISFGVIPASEANLPNPAELFLGALCACILKNVERFSNFMNFTYSFSEIVITATRLEKPPRLDEIHYALKIRTKDAGLNTELLQKNIEKHGTIFNTVKATCTITGAIEIITD